MSRLPARARISAKVAIFEALSSVTDGSYLTCAEICSFAKKMREVHPDAVKTCLNTELAGCFEQVQVPSDPRIKKLHPTCTAYRWRDAIP